MGILYALLFAGVFKGIKVNPRKITRTFRKESKTGYNFIKNILLMIYAIVSFIFNSIAKITKKNICQETVEKVKLPENIISIDEYRLKKVK